MVTAASRMTARKTQRQDWKALAFRLFSEVGCSVLADGNGRFMIGVLLGLSPDSRQALP